MEMSLTKTAKQFKSGVKVILIVMAAYYLFLLVLFPSAKNFLLDLFVDRNPPNPKYGLLDPLQFEPALTKGEPPKITLATKDGRLPAGLPKKMSVYKFKGIQYSYLAGKGAQRDADYLGYSEGELISDLKGKEYKWRSLETGGILVINTETTSVLLGTDLVSKNKIYPAGGINQKMATDTTIGLLSALGRYNSQIYNPANFKFTYGEYAGVRLQETKTPADAALVRVDLFGNMNEYPILGPTAKTGIIWVMFGKEPRQNRPTSFPFLQIYNWDLTSDKDASYPIITVGEAWKQVVAGKGIISDIVPKNSNPFENKKAIPMEKVLINKIYLAYYETTQFQRYLQPIYVFEGSYTYTGTDGGTVVIYYPAVTAQYTSKIAPIMPMEDTTQTSQSSPSVTDKQPVK